MKPGPGPGPRPTNERIWLCYLAAVMGIAATTPGSGEGYDPARHLAVHAAVAVAVLLARRIAITRGQEAARVLRGALAVLGLPVVFSAMGCILPGVHPEPYEFLWLQVDRAVFGADLAALLAGRLPRWFVELLQVDYALFYLLCIGAALLAGWRSGGHAFDRATLLMVGGFLASYLGYLLVPTLAPKVVLPAAGEVEGLWLTAPLRQLIDAAEANRWDCFPSGHTMMTTISLIVLWRWNRGWFWLLLAPGLLLIASTVLLHYHWASDVLAGAVLAWPCARLCDHLADRDGWPAAPPVGLRRA